MNPYQSDANPDSKTDSGVAAPSGDDDELARRQMRLVIRLAILSVVTTASAIAAFIVSGFEPITTAVALALILGIGFTVSWKA